MGGIQLGGIFLNHMSHEKRAPGWLGYIGDDVLPSYIGNSNKPLTSLKLALENGWLEEDRFLLGRHLFRCELLVSGSV